VQQSPPPPSASKTRLPRWERRLPKKLIVASTPGENSLRVTVDIETTDTCLTRRTQALIDCGATGLFIDRRYITDNKISTRKLSKPIPVYNVNGTLNEAGLVDEIVDVVLRYNGHTERALFAVTSLGKLDMILGYTWLREPNPEIDWASKEVCMSRCPSRCLTCREEA
jgi:hypothetical protein